MTKYFYRYIYMKRAENKLGFIIICGVYISQERRNRFDSVFDCFSITTIRNSSGRRFLFKFNF